MLLHFAANNLPFLQMNGLNLSTQICKRLLISIMFGKLITFSEFVGSSAHYLTLDPVFYAKLLQTLQEHTKSFSKSITDKPN